MFIKIKNEKYSVVKELKDCSCEGCHFYIEDTGCDLSENSSGFDTDTCYKNRTILLKTVPQTKPTIKMNLELDLSDCILPVFFSVKNLRLQSLDTALKNQSDAYNVSVKDLPQETIEMLAEELKAEFIRRNTKVAV